MTSEKHLTNLTNTHISALMVTLVTNLQEFHWLAEPTPTKSDIVNIVVASIILIF